jgi:tetratricopeptide (TPR) repeat protein
VSNPALLNQALAFHSNGQLAKAEALYLEILNVSPEDPQALHWLGMLYATSGEAQRAESYLFRSLNLEPSNLTFINNLLGVLLSLEQTEKAVSLYEQYWDLARQHIEFALNCALLLSKVDRNADAINLIEALLIRNPENVHLLFCLGNLHKLEHQLDFAQKAFEKAIALNPLASDARKNLANTLFENGYFQKAQAHFETLSKSDPNNSDYLYSMGLCFESEGRFDEAIKLYNAASKRDPKHIDARRNRSFCRLKLGKYKEGWIDYNLLTTNHVDNSERLRAKIFDDPSSSTTVLRGEQGLGDQILLCSLLSLLPQNKQFHIKVDHRLVGILQRAFCTMEFSALDTQKDCEGSFSLVDLAKVMLSRVHDLKKRKYPFLLSNEGFLSNPRRCIKRIGISWRSFNAKSCTAKSIPLNLLLDSLEGPTCELISLQYGDISTELHGLVIAGNRRLLIRNDVDMTQNIEGLLKLVQSCDLIVTTSNTTAHLAGASGIETFLLAPKGISKHWYWYACDERGFSLWYPSIRILQQTTYADWAEPLVQLQELLLQDISLQS